jgi:hypothetical protein
MTKQALQQLNEQIITDLKNICHLFQVGDEQNALLNFISFTENFEMFIFEVDSFQTKAAQALLDIKTLESFLREVFEGLSAQDYTLITDLLEFEILPMLERVQTTLLKGSSNEI